jgi:hypothetical protein
MRGNDGSLGCRGLAGAKALYVGSTTSRSSSVVGDVERDRSTPVDIDVFAPAPRASLAALIEESRRDISDGGRRRPMQTQALRASSPTTRRPSSTSAS